jgi:hypothetical protein
MSQKLRAFWVTLSVLIPLFVVNVASSQELFCPTALEREVLRHINLERQARGLPPLRMEIRLSEAARLHSEDMAQNDFMSHDGSNGSTPSDRVQLAGYPYFSLGETVAAGYPTAAEVVEGWMNSPPHQAILLGDYEDVGVGYGFNAASFYGHYWTADFGIAQDGGVPPSPACTLVTVYEDAEDGASDGWAVYDGNPPGAVVSNVYDGVRQSQVIELVGAGRANGYRLRGPWHNSGQFIIEWSMAFSESLTIYVDVETTAGHRYMQYTAVDYDLLGTSGYVHHGLGSQVLDGQWRTFVRDLQADLDEAQSGTRVIEVNGIFLRGSGRIDDVSLRSYSY